MKPSGLRLGRFLNKFNFTKVFLIYKYIEACNIKYKFKSVFKGAAALTSRSFKEGDFVKVIDLLNKGVEIGLEAQKLSSKLTIKSNLFIDNQVCKFRTLSFGSYLLISLLKLSISIYYISNLVNCCDVSEWLTFFYP